VSGLGRLGWDFQPPQATFYCWIPVPPGFTSSELAVNFLDKMNIVVTPGNGFGKNGEGYFRVSLTVPESRLEEAIRRIAEAHQRTHSKKK
jgi:LL-diaminopimelate aminotransferase